MLLVVERLRWNLAVKISQKDDEQIIKSSVEKSKIAQGLSAFSLLVTVPRRGV